MNASWRTKRAGRSSPAAVRRTAGPASGLVSAMLLAAAMLLGACQSTAVEEKPAPADAQPTAQQQFLGFRYEDPGIKIECEKMQLSGCSAATDETASGGAYITLSAKESAAECRVLLPAGNYECLVAEKAYDNEHATFHLYIDEAASRLYPSNPPLGMWELTTRVPVYLKLEEERTVTVTLRSDGPAKKGQTGMALDYIQFVRQ